MGAPTDAGILQLEIEFVSSLRKRIGINTSVVPHGTRNLRNTLSGDESPGYYHLVPVGRTDQNV
jgi:hypothetical protein